MRQTEPAVSLDRLVAQARHEGIARAGKAIARRLEHVEISLLALGAELLDRQLHGMPLGGLAAELGVARLFELERKLRAARARHAPVRHDMHAIRHDVVQEPLIMGDDEHRALLVSGER